MIKRYRIRNFPSDFLFLMICIALVPPAGLVTMRNQELHRISIVVSLVCIFVLFIIRRGAFQIFIRIALPLIAYATWIMVSNLINSVSDTSAYGEILIYIFSTISLALILSGRHFRVQFLNVLYYYQLVMLLANFIFQLIKPSGLPLANRLATQWQAEYLLSNANYFVFPFLLLIGLAIHHNVLNRATKSLNVYFIGAIEIMSFIICGDAGSTTGLLCIVIALVLHAMITSKAFGGFSEIFARHFRGIALGLGVLTVYLITSNIVLQAFQRIGISTSDAGSFEARVEIWRNAVARIMDSPIIGHGTRVTEFAYSSQLGGVLRSAHNNYLQITFYGGIIALVLYIYGIFYSYERARNALRENNRFIVSFSMLVGLFLISFLVEQNPFSIEFAILLLIGSTDTDVSSSVSV